MSRLNSFLDTDIMEREDVSMILEDYSQDLRILRVPALSDDDGFRAQTPSREPVLLKIVKGRIDRRDRVYESKTGEVSKSVTTLYIATMYYKGLMIGDLIDDGTLQYQVKFVNKIGQSFTEAEIEILS